MIDAAKLFDEWAEKYDEYLPRFPVYKKLMELVLQNANISSGAKVLDVGIGTGNTSLGIFAKTPCKITGVDVSEKMMRIAKEKAKEIGAEIETIVSSADKMVLDTDFDLAVAAFSIHHLEQKGKLEAFKRIHNSLKKGGRFILVDITIEIDASIRDEKRLEHIINRWGCEALYALKYIGPEAVDTSLRGLKDVFYRNGEYAETPSKLKELLKQAGFELVKHEEPDKRIGYQVFVCDKKK